MTSDISTAQWIRVRDIFEGALELAGDDRDSFLSERCREDLDLRRRVERLLRAFENNCDFLETPLDFHSGSEDFHPLDERLGAYRLIRRLGSGGMGVVYLAERDDGHFNLRVAVKIVWPESSIPDTRERFARERQILANLDHPNISRLLDGGVTSEGLPYLVMEYVDGDRITSYARENDLTVQEKLRLFREVCLAVAHAHSKRIVHRDIKPGNILVTRERRIKLLDFGIARVLQEPGDSTDDPARLKTGTPLLSFDYASPEQIRGERVDIPSDLYSLGVVLYELVAGRLPYDLPNRSPLVMSKVITEDRPLPLTSIGTPWMTEQIDRILKRALAKEIEARHGSAEELATEIESVLGGRSIERRGVSRLSGGLRLGAFGVMLAGLLLLTTVLLLMPRYSGGHTVTGGMDRYIARINEAKSWVDKGRHQLARDILNGLEQENAGFELGYLMNQEARPLEFEIGKSVDQSYLIADANRLIVVTERFNELSLWDISANSLVPGSIRRGRGIWGRTHPTSGQVLIVSQSGNQLEFEDYFMPRNSITCPLPASGVIAIGASNRLIHTVSSDGEVRGWQPGGCTSTVVFESRAGAGGDYSFHPSLPLLFLKSGGTLRVWNFATGRELLTNDAPTTTSLKNGSRGSIDQVFVDEKVELLGLTRVPGMVEIRELGTDRKASAELDRSTFLQLYLDSARRRLVILHSNGKVDQLSLDRPESDTTIFRTAGEFTGGSLFDGGRYLALAERLGRLVIYDLERKIKIVSKQVDSTFGNISIRSLEKERRLITSGSDGRVKLWEIDDLLRERSTLLNLESQINAVTISPDGQWIAAGGEDRRVYLWNTQALDREARTIDVKWEILSLAFSPASDELAVAGQDPEVQIWRLQGSRPIRTLTHGAPVHMTLYSPDGRSIATAGFDNLVRIHSMGVTAAVSQLQHNGEVTSVVFMPDGMEVITAGIDGEVRLWDLRTGIQTRRLYNTSRTIWSLALTRDGQRLAVIGDDPVPLTIDLVSGRRTALEAVAGGGKDLVFSQDGRRLFVAGSQQSIGLLDAATGREVLQLKDFNGNISSLALSADGRLLVSGDLSGTVKLFRSNR